MILDRSFETDDGQLRWGVGGSGPPIVLVHGTPYSSLVWENVFSPLAERHRVYVLDHLGYGASDRHDGQDLSLVAQGRRFAALLASWELDAPTIVATDIGGVIALRALLIEGASYGGLLLFDAVTGGAWERGLFALMLEHSAVFEALPAYAHEALVASHMRNATERGFRPGRLSQLLEPWLGEAGQAAYYRQYRQLRQRDTADYEALLAEITIPVRLLWGRQDRIVPPEFAHWIAERLPHAPLSWVDSCGHLLSEDAPATLLAEILHLA